MTNGMGKHHSNQVQDQPSTAREQTIVANRGKAAVIPEKKNPDAKDSSSADASGK